MFYAQFVLSKKGPLAKIWLAAHWEKKLSKQQIFDTNVEKACDEILKPKVKMALRTTGHLLLGIVRIYSRKAKYLLADCNEAFLKIKMAFRPGQVDLPEEGREANANAITLPEVFADFDSALPDFNDLDIQQQLSLNQSRIDDITLKEDLPQQTGFSDFAMDDFGESAAGMRGSGGLHGDESSIQLGRDAAHSVSAIGAAGHEHLEASDALIPDDFGGQFDEKLFEGMDDEIFTDALRDTDSVHPDRPSTVLPPGAAVDETGMPIQTPEQSSFALEPLDATVVQGLDKHKGKRKRKLIVDECKNITGEEMKQQMTHTEDLIVGLELAPPTKRMMQLNEVGRADKLFALPASEALTSQRFVQLYQSRVTTLRCREDDLTAAGRKKRTIIEDMELMRADQIDFDRPPTAVDDRLNIIREETGEIMAPGMEIEMPSPIGEEPEDDEDEPLSPRGDKSRKKSRQTIDKSQTIDESNIDDGDEPEDRRWTKRTQHILNTITQRFGDGNECIFADISKNATRKSAAQKFYTLLVLKKWQAIDVGQDEPMGDIVIRPGAKLNETHTD